MITELQQRMAKAIADNDVEAMETIAAEITRGRADRHKTEVEAQRKEFEALAGKRGELSVRICKAIDAAIPDIAAALAAVKCQDFRYTMKGALDANKVAQATSSVGLNVPQPRKAKAGNGNGGAGKTKDDYGLSLQEVYDKFKTAEDETNMAAAVVKDEEASAKLGKVTNSNQWRVKDQVKKRVIASGELTPSK